MYFPPPSVPVTGKFNVFWVQKEEYLQETTKKKGRGGFEESTHRGRLKVLHISRIFLLPRSAVKVTILQMMKIRKDYSYWKISKSYQDSQKLAIQSISEEADRTHVGKKNKKNQWLIHRSLQFNQFRKFGGIRQNPCRKNRKEHTSG